MKKFLILILLGLIIMPQIAKAEEAKPLQLALFDPVQLIPEKESIEGARLSMFYTANKDVTGFSLVWLGLNRATGNVRGVEIGLANWVEGFAYGGQIGLVNHAGKRFVGLQYGAVNVTEADLTGLQWGLVNWTGGFMHGAQYGIFNYSADVHGLQLGIINYAKSLDGLQIGLGNYNGNKEPMEFMVLANWSF